MAETAVPTAGAAPPTAAAPTARQILDRCRRTTEPALRRAVDSLPGTMRRITGYHLGWWDEHGREQAAHSGKAVRPALTLLAADAVGTPAPASAAMGTAAVPAAVAVELVHNFSLVHDDIMDGDTTRRHRPTVWTVFGVGPAILAGDALLALSFEVLAGSGHPRAVDGIRMLGATVADLLEGQADDLAFEKRDDVLLAECLRMARRKTGALLECSGGLGALFGGGNAAQISQLRAFGADLGLAFQLTDDVLGIWGDQRKTGKPRYSDLRTRKKSVPVVAALRSRSAAGRHLADAYADTYRGQRQPTDRDLARLADSVAEAGGRDWCLTQARVVLDRALDRLDSDAPLARAEELRALGRLIGERDR